MSDVERLVSEHTEPGNLATLMNTRLRRLVEAKDAQIAELEATRRAEARRHDEQLADNRRTSVFLRRDLEVKEAYIAALEARISQLEAEASQREADAARLRDIEAAALRVPTTPRYWLADRLNAVLKRMPRAHRFLRATFVRIARIDRSA